MAQLIVGDHSAWGKGTYNRVMEQRSIDDLLRSDNSAETAQEILAWFHDLKDRIARGDMMIGILPVSEAAKVPDALAKAIACGNERASIDLALWLADPPIGEPDVARGETVLLDAISRGVEAAVLPLVRLRWILRRDEATEVEREETWHLIEGLASRHPDDAEALYYLGILKCGGFGCDQDPSGAFEIQKKAADAGSVDAMFELYAHYANGLGVARDDRQAFEHNLRAAEAGHARATYNMGAFYATGTHVGQDMEKAAEWYARSADAGNGRAAATLGYMYATGGGVAKDVDRARELFDDAESYGFDASGLRGAAGL